MQRGKKWSVFMAHPGEQKKYTRAVKVAMPPID